MKNITSEYKIIQELSLGIIYSLCVEEEAFEVFVESDGIKKMFLFIQNKEVNKNGLNSVDYIEIYYIEI